MWYDEDVYMLEGVKWRLRQSSRRPRLMVTCGMDGGMRHESQFTRRTRTEEACYQCRYDSSAACLRSIIFSLVLLLASPRAYVPGAEFSAVMVDDPTPTAAAYGSLSCSWRSGQVGEGGIGYFYRWFWAGL